MAKRQNFVVGSTNPNTQSRTDAQLNNGWNQFEVLRSGVLDGVFNAVSDYSNDSSNEIANAIQSITGSQPTGQNQSELAGALNQMRQDIETSSLTFKGYISDTAPSSSTYALLEGNLWIDSATLPTTFPVAASSIKVWDGTAWVAQSDSYTVANFDFWRNVNDNEGYYWFGGQWVVMSTDMSTTYFTLNQTSGKWEIKDSVNLPGSPTTTTPDANASDTQIATVKYIKDALAALVPTIGVAEMFDWKWKDCTTNATTWALSDGNWVTGKTDAYQHLVDDYNAALAEVPRFLTTTNNLTMLRNPEYDRTVSDVDYYAWTERGSGSLLATYFTTTLSPGSGYQLYKLNPDMQPSSLYVSSVDDGTNTETVAGYTITYYKAPDGHKIALAGQDNTAYLIYVATGVAWYYILDTANQRFKLPRTKHNKYADTLGVVGNGMTLGLTNGTDNVGVCCTTEQGSSYGLRANASRYGTPVSTGNFGLNVAGSFGVTTDATKSGIVAQQTQDTDQYKYLYFYVGA